MSLISRRRKVPGGRRSQKLHSGKIRLTLALGHSCPRSPVAASAQLSSSNAEQPWKVGDAGRGMMQDVGCRVQDMRYGMWDARSGMWDDAGCGMWGAGCGMWGTGCRIWDIGHGVQDVGCWTQAGWPGIRCWPMWFGEPGSWAAMRGVI